MTYPSSALEPSGVQATHIADLFWAYFDIAALVFVLVTGALVVALFRKRRPDLVPKAEVPEEVERPRRRAVTIATALTVVTLVVMLVLSIVTSRALASLGTKDAVAVKVIGHRWWWEIRYPAAVAGTQFTTAYELHVPVGRPIELELSSTDVIHSFWVPSLHGKRDLVPGKTTSYVIRADRPGRYDGICAEYCGTQHANMRFVVVVETEEEFKAWLAHSLSPAVPPADPVTKAGQEIFLKSRCATCHAIGGTDAFAAVGPDLTHFASRRELAMGTLANTNAHLASWIADPHASKPGVIMPGTPLSPDDLHALTTYLGSLK